MWININTNEIIKTKKPITINNIQYPASIFDIWMDFQLSSIGIKPFSEEYYDKKYYSPIGYSDQEVDGTIVRTYELEPKISEEEILAEKLIQKKNKKIAEIDSKSITLLENGFTYGGETFDILNDEERWKELLLAATSGILPYPKTLYSKEKVGVVVGDLNEVKAFCGAFMAAREGVLDPARALKEQVMACTTEEEVDLIEDSR